jgi:hypothetical protein
MPQSTDTVTSLMAGQSAVQFPVEQIFLSLFFSSSSSSKFPDWL